MCNNISKCSRILLENKTLGSYMKYITKLIFFSISCLIFSNLLSKDIKTEKFTTDDIYKIKNIHSVDLSDSANQITYIETFADKKNDDYRSTLWLHDIKKNKSRKLIKKIKSISYPQFSPDEKYIAYISTGKREFKNYSQLWVINLKTARKRELTKIKNNVTDFQWSPDGKKIAIVVNHKKEDTEDTRPPIVVERYQFKKDGYDFIENENQHIHIKHLDQKEMIQITEGAYDHVLPSWSPDGEKLAFASKRDNPDIHNNWDLYILDLNNSSKINQLTHHKGSDSDPYSDVRPQWSPDGKSIAYVRSGDPNLIWYSLSQIAITDIETKSTKLITQHLDRNTSFPKWSNDGEALYFVIEDDTKSQLAVMQNNEISKITPDHMFISNWSDSFDIKDKTIALILSTTSSPEEIYIQNEDRLEKVSNHNQDLLKNRKINPIEKISFESFDGVIINGMMIKPYNFDPSKQYPLIIRIHGGPVSQYDLSFSIERQIFASQQYVVVAVNPRGSSGRGEAFQKAIFADWGNIDAKDIMKAADYAISTGFIDENRMGIGGWSYGSMLTNYVIAKDQRFKAATSGAGISNILAGFGSDQYIKEYIIELGAPWENLNGWLKVSHPFLNADKIKTPTLFLVGEKDFNVPLIGSEQMYQALKYLSIPTKLIIYPGEFHSFSVPSYEKDVIDRYLKWYDKYIINQ